MAKKEEIKTNYWEEKVPFTAFRDGNKYKDDIVVAVNGKAWVIQRGVQVMIPRNVKAVIEQSIKQDAETNEWMNAQEDKFLDETRKRG